MSPLFEEYDDFIHAEMMVHPALFTHPQAKRVVIIDTVNTHLLEETLKHPHITDVWQLTSEMTTMPAHNDARVHFVAEEAITWLAEQTPESFDLIIADKRSTTVFTNDFYTVCLNALCKQGMFVRQCESQFNPVRLKASYHAMRHAGFQSLQILHFTQPGAPCGCGAAIIAFKQPSFKRIREKDIYNKTFATRYYNFDVHKAALALPEFIREDLYELTP